MATIKSLPPEVLYAILDATIGTRTVLSFWTHSLCLLSVCREWRQTGIPLFYGVGIIWIRSLLEPPPPGSDRFENIDDRRTISLVTNLDLIKQNGLLHRVQQLNFGNYTFDNHGLFIPCIDALLKNGDSLAKPPVVLRTQLREAGIAYNAEDDDSGEMRRNFGAAARSTATALAQVLPSVNNVQVVGTEADDIMAEFCAALYGRYSTQLKHLENKLVFGPRFLETPVLTNMYFSLSELDPDFHIHTIPPSVTTLDVRLKDVLCWDTFIGLEDTAHRGVTSLSLTYTGFDAASLQPSIKSTEYRPRLLFPNLAKLKIKDAYISADSCCDLLQSPLQELTIIGFRQLALQICQSDLGSLNTLCLKLRSGNNDIIPNSGIVSEDYIRDLNKIFEQTRGIDTAYLYLSEFQSPRSWRIVNWPHLTHVRFDMDIDFDDLLAIMRASPNLVYLRISFNAFNKGGCRMAKKALRNMKQSFLSPIESSIRRLIFDFVCDRPISSFIKALRVFKLYLPLVSAIDIHLPNKDVLLI